MKKIILAITGASGVQYAKRLFDYLQGKAELHVVISNRGAELLRLELDLDPDYFAGAHVVLHKNNRINVSIASGSFLTDGMVIVPASMGTLGRIAAGVSGSLIERAADVMLKERKRIIVVPRETPFSSIHLQNMLTLDRAGAIIMPASPGFYHFPKNVEDLVDFMVARIVDQLGLDQDLIPPYTA